MFPSFFSNQSKQLFFVLVVFSHCLTASLIAVPPPPFDRAPVRPINASRMDSADLSALNRHMAEGSNLEEEPQESPPQADLETKENLKALISDVNSLKKLRAIKTMAILRACNFDFSSEDAAALWISPNTGNIGNRILMLNDTVELAPPDLSSPISGYIHEGNSVPIIRPEIGDAPLTYIIPTIIPSDVSITIGSTQYRSQPAALNDIELPMVRHLIVEAFEVYYGKPVGEIALQLIENRLADSSHVAGITVEDICMTFANLDENNAITEVDPKVQQLESFFRQQHLQSQQAIYQAACKMNKHSHLQKQEIIHHAQQYTRTHFEYLLEAPRDALEWLGRTAGVAATTVSGSALGATTGALAFHSLLFFNSIIPSITAFTAITTAHVWGPVAGMVAGTAIAVPLTISAWRVYSSLLCAPLSVLPTIHSWMSSLDASTRTPPAAPIQFIETMSPRVYRNTQMAGLLIGTLDSLNALNSSIDPIIMAEQYMRSDALRAPLITLAGSLYGALFGIIPAYRIGTSYFSPSTAWQKLKQTMHYWRGDGIAETLLSLQRYQDHFDSMIDKYRSGVGVTQGMPDPRSLQRTPQEIQSIIASLFEQPRDELQHLIGLLVDKVEEIDSRLRPYTGTDEVQE